MIFAFVDNASSARARHIPTCLQRLGSRVEYIDKHLQQLNKNSCGFYLIERPKEGIWLCMYSCIYPGSNPP